MRFLVVEGNTREARLQHRDGYGLTPSKSYSAVLQTLEPSAVCDIAFPADEGANLPDGAGLESYDAIVLTGSALNAYAGESGGDPPDRARPGELRVGYAVFRILLGHPGRGPSGGRRRAGQSDGAARSASRGGSWPPRRGGAIRCWPAGPRPGTRRRCISTP